jgi:hypothetical protein
MLRREGIELAVVRTPNPAVNETTAGSRTTDQESHSGAEPRILGRE